MVLEIIVQFVVERLPIQRSKALWTGQFAIQRERRLERRLLVRRPERFAFIKCHLVLRQFPCREHIGHRPQITLRRYNQLVHHFGRDLQAFAERDR